MVSIILVFFTLLSVARADEPECSMNSNAQTQCPDSTAMLQKRVDISNDANREPGDPGSGGAPSLVGGPIPDAICDASKVQRRRRNKQMCSCRRRSSSKASENGWRCSGNAMSLEATPKPSLAPPPAGGPTPGAICDASKVQRRRRNKNMCSCRRRSSSKASENGWRCSGNAMSLEATPKPSPSVAPTAEPVPPNSINSDKRHYAIGESISITFVRNQSGWKRFADKIAVYPTFDVTGDMIPTTKHAFQMFRRYSTRMWVKSCGTTSCKGHAASGSMEFGPDGVQSGKNHNPTWPLQVGCYKLALTSWEQRPHPTKPGKLSWQQFIAAVSEQFSVGATEMTLCRPGPSPWSWPSSLGAGQTVSLGRGQGFSVTAQRFPIDGQLFEPLGGGSFHPSYGMLRIGKWLYGPGDRYGNYGQPRRFHPVMRSGTNGVIWKDEESGTVQATWMSPDMKGADTQTIYSTPAHLAAVACDEKNNELIMLLGFGGGNARFVKVSSTTGDIISETATFWAGDKLGMKSFEAKTSMASMAWNVEAGIVGLVLSGSFTHGHQGAWRSIINATTLDVLGKGAQTSSHNLGNTANVASDGSFLSMQLSDNFPRGISIHRFTDSRRRSSSRIVPYRIKTCGNNCNNVYTELAHPGVVEASDGLVLFFAGEREPLDEDPSLVKSVVNVGRNVGFVKVGKDLNEKQVLSPGKTEVDSRGKSNQGINWLTSFTDPETSASRVKTVRLEAGKTFLYWEVWSRSVYQYTQVMLVDDNGKPLTAPFSVPSVVALGYSDDMLATRPDQVVAYAGTCDKKCEHGSGGRSVGVECQSENCHLVRYVFCVGSHC